MMRVKEPELAGGNAEIRSWCYRMRNGRRGQLWRAGDIISYQLEGEKSGL